mgnify:FL=1
MAKSKETNTNEQPTAPAVSDVLEDLKAQDFEMVVVVGLDKKGNAAVTASNNALPMVHWLLNRGLFEMNLFEKNQRQPSTEKVSPKEEESNSEIITPDSEIITPNS